MNGGVTAGACVAPAGPAFRNRLLDWMPEFSLLLVTTVGGLWAAGRWIDPSGDPGIWWSTIHRLAGGERLYRDVYLQFGPLSPYLLSLGVRVFGDSVRYLLFATWLPAVGASVLLLRATRPALNLMERFAVAGLLLSESLFAPGPGRLVFAYAPAAVHALFLSIAALLFGTRSGPVARPYLAGFLAGLAFYSKQEIGLACLLALIASLSLRPRSIGQAARSLVAFAVVGLLGGAVVFSSASVESLHDRSHFWPLAFSPPEEWRHLYRGVAGISVADWRSLLTQSVWWLLSYVGLVAFLGLLIGRERRPFQWLSTAIVVALVCLWWGAEGFTSRGSFHPTALSMMVAMLSVLLLLARSELPERASLLAFCVFGALMGARAAFSTERLEPYSGIAHFVSAFTWVLFFCVLVPKLVPGGERGVMWTRRAWAITLLAVSGVETFAGAQSLAEPAKQSVPTPQGRIFVSAEVAPLFRAIGANLHSGESVWVLPEINGVDALFLAHNVSPYSSHLPGWLDEKAQIELLRRIEARPPDVVIIFSRHVKEYGVKEFGEGYDRLLSEWVERNYSAVEAMPAGRILRRSRRSSRTENRPCASTERWESFALLSTIVRPPSADIEARTPCAFARR